MEMGSAYPRTVRSLPLKPGRSPRRRWNVRRAVCRCFGGAVRSNRNIWSMKSDAASSLRSRRCWGLIAADSALRRASAPSAGVRSTPATHLRSSLPRTQTRGVSARKVPPCPSWSASYASVAPSTKRTQPPLRRAKVNCHGRAKPANQDDKIRRLFLGRDRVPWNRH